MNADKRGSEELPKPPELPRSFEIEKQQKVNERTAAKKPPQLVEERPLMAMFKVLHKNGALALVCRPARSKNLALFEFEFAERYRTCAPALLIRVFPRSSAVKFWFFRISVITADQW